LRPGRQFRVLIAAATRELVWGLPAVAREVDAWRLRARAIPEAAIRTDGLSALGSKRGHTDGAALFTILCRARNLDLLRLLVAYELIWDFLDTVNERGAQTGQANGKQLHLALVEALDPRVPFSDYYRHHPWRCDGGYLRTLVNTCRQCLSSLPSYGQIRPFVVEEANRAQVLAINHELDPTHRDAALREWAAREFPSEQEATWFELSGAASASLTIHALLAFAAEPECTAQEVEQTRRAYFPWISAATTMLDSYVDQVEDTENDDHSYVSHYPTPEFGAQRICQLVERSLQEARALKDGERHVLITACMVAMYLSKDSARTRAARETTRAIAGAGGPLTRLLLPILRLWRMAYAQRAH
jgi:tetraprenyl-beta-curcumene synthase